MKVSYKSIKNSTLFSSPEFHITGKGHET